MSEIVLIVSLVKKKFGHEQEKESYDTKRINGNLFNLFMFCTEALKAQQRIDSLGQCFVIKQFAFFFLFLKMCYLV